MKFLVDNQLPVTLAQYLKNRGFECRHVLHEQLADADDAQICRYAEAHDFIIISKDEDFIYYAKRPTGRCRFNLSCIKTLPLAQKLPLN